MNRYKTLLFGAAMALPMAGSMIAYAAPNNLIVNGTFDNSVSGWDNFSGNPTLYKQTLQITNTYAGSGNSYYSGWYCVKVKPGAEYITEADYWVPASAPENSGASLQLHYYASNDCSGSNLLTGGAGKSGGKTPDQRNAWEHVTLKETAPDGAHSVRVRASAVKEPKAPANSIPQLHTVYFDNVSFVEQLKIVLPQPTETPKGPGDIVVKPTPTQAPKGPGDIVADPQPTQTPKGPDDVVSNPQPTATPGVQEPGEGQPSGSDQPANNANDNPPDAGEVPTVPPSAPDTGNTGDSGLITPETGIGLMLTAFGFGGGALALAFALRRRRDEDDE